MSSNFDNYTADIAAQGVSDLAQDSMAHQTPTHLKADQPEAQQTEAKRFLREGINAAKAGNRADARLLLLEAAQLDARNENVWLWLASISEQPAELFEFLQKVLEINPENARAQEWHKQTRNLLVNTEIQRGAALVKENERAEAAECFRRATEHDSTNETAWLWRASVADEIEDKLAFLQRILHLNPNNEKAAASFEVAKRQMARNLLKRGSTAAVSGDLATAREILADVMEYDPQFEEAWMLKAFLSETIVEKAECFIKVLEINPDNSQASTGLTSLRAMLGAPTEETAQETVVTPETSENFAELPSPETEASADFSAENEELNAVAPQGFAEETVWENQETVEMDAEFSAVSQPDTFANLAQEQIEAEHFEDFQVAESAEDAITFEKKSEAEFNESAEEQTVSFAEEKQADAPEFVEICGCPFCAAQNPVTAVRCTSCKAFVSMDETDNLLVQDTLDDGAVRDFIERIHQEQTERELQPHEHINLGYAYLNLRNYKKCAQHFERAMEIAPEDENVRAKVNRWLEKLREIAPELLGGATSSGKTIMVVDDSPTVRKLIMGKLEKHGHRVVAAVDGMDALGKINEVNADLILLDITMPRLDGYQLCKLIRQNAVTKHIPVVMISGKDGFFDKVRGRMAGSTAYITKPFGPETLLQTIEAYCK